MLHVWSISGWSPSQVTVKVPVYRDPLLAWDWGQPKIYLPIFGFSFLVNVQKNEPQRWTVWFVMKTHVRRDHHGSLGPSKFHLSNDQNLRYWLYIGDEILPGFIEIIISQYKDPFKTTSRMECHKRFERCSFLVFFPGVA